MPRGGQRRSRLRFARGVILLDVSCGYLQVVSFFLNNLKLKNDDIFYFLTMKDAK